MNPLDAIYKTAVLLLMIINTFQIGLLVKWQSALWVTQFGILRGMIKLVTGE